MKRAIVLTVAVGVLVATGSALGSQAKHCGVVTYRWTRNGQHHAGQDAVFVVQGTTSCTTARRIDVRADEGLRTSGWHCALSRHRTVTTCTSSSHRAEIQGLLFTRPPVTPTPMPSPVPTPTPAPTPTACYPTTASGGCYEPGEYCPVADYGTSGVAGDGEAITCEDNNGWRWEPTTTSTPAPTPIPAPCYPTTASGGCYEPGEYCPVADYGSSGVAGDGQAITCEDNNGWRWEPT
jgi:hypothetical protein